MTERSLAVPAKSAASPRLAEWLAGWPLIVAGTAGMSMTAVHFYALGVMLGPIHDDTGWSRSAITAGQSIAAALAVVLSPVSGVLLDRYGPRWMAVPGTIAFGLGMIGFASVGPSLVQWYAMWILISFAGIGAKPAVWTGAVSVAFVQSRALAFAVIIGGIAITGGIVPSITNMLVQNYGWRGAHIGLGLIWGAIVLPLSFLLPKKLANPRTHGDAGAPEPVSGLSVRAALRLPVFHRLCLTSLLLTLGFSTLNFHFVPLLHDRGLAISVGAAIAGAISLSSFAGRLVTGVLLDRMSGAIVGGVALSLPVIPILLLLLFHSDSVWLLTGVAILIGVSVGSELDLLTYLTTRHFGLRNYGTLYGFVMAAAAIGAGTGPVIGSALRDATGSYDVLLWALLPAFVISPLAIATSGPYPDDFAGT